MALCAAMLASCGGSGGSTTTQSETQQKPSLPNGKITERGDRGSNGVNDAKSGAEEGIDKVKRDVERKMNDMEDATHGTARQDGHDNDTEAETEAPAREHRPAAPKGK